LLWVETTSSTSKVVVVWPSSTPGCDVEYDFGQVAVDKPVIDWSGTAAIWLRQSAPSRSPKGMLRVKGTDCSDLHLRNRGMDAQIDAYIPMSDGREWPRAETSSWMALRSQGAEIRRVPVFQP
jgi:2-methylaconitate cis-trans-isomerase PrpF